MTTPRHALAALILAQILSWVTLPFLASSSPPLDVVESLVWGREWLLGTHKHPTLVAWLSELSFQVTRSPILGPYLLSQISVGLTYYFVFEIGRRLTNERNALVGTLLLTSVLYFTWPTPEFNHNVVQLPIWSGAILLFTLARERPTHPAAWIGLGAVAGLGLYAKYSVLILYAVLGVWLLLDKPMRRALKTPWPWLALALAVGLASPHLIWLAENKFAAVEYIDKRSEDGTSPFASMAWIGVQIAAHLPMTLFFAIVGYRRVKALPADQSLASDLPYVAFLGLVPSLLTAAMTDVLNIGPQDMWGMPMLTLSGLLAVLLLRRQWTEALSLRASWTAIGFVVVLAVAYALTVWLSPLDGSGKRNAWPMEEISEKARAAWYAHTQKELRIVSGGVWLAGLIAAGSPERPSVVYDGELPLSPWLDAQRLEEAGALYVWAGRYPPDKLIPKDVTPAATGLFHVQGTKLPEGIVGYAIQLPREP
jgi:4-amino-4-deoxy-L-arabinose transferase-like glycosyltransferase